MLSLSKFLKFWLLQGLSPLEERLVAARLPFMQIRPGGLERQSVLRGAVVNVENDLDICAEVLPRRFKDTSTVHVQLKRRMRYRRPYMYEIIRPAKVYEAAQYLVKTELYDQHNIALSDEWSRYKSGGFFQGIQGLPAFQINHLRKFLLLQTTRWNLYAQMIRYTTNKKMTKKMVTFKCLVDLRKSNF